jgi:hypothetical protein
LRGHQDGRLVFAVNLLEKFANERDKFRGAINARTCSVSIFGLRDGDAVGNAFEEVKRFKPP